MKGSNKPQKLPERANISPEDCIFPGFLAESFFGETILFFLFPSFGLYIAQPERSAPCLRHHAQGHLQPPNHQTGGRQAALKLQHGCLAHGLQEVCWHFPDKKTLLCSILFFIWCLCRNTFSSHSAFLGILLLLSSWGSPAVQVIDFFRKKNIFF